MTTALARLAGRHRLALIREIADSDLSFEELAIKHDVTPDDVVDFAARFADEISQVRKATTGLISNEVAGLWIAKRENRLAEYQRDVEFLEVRIRTMIDHGEDVPRDLAVLMRSRLDLLKAAGAETSSYPADTGAARTSYVIEAEDFTADLT